MWSLLEACALGRLWSTPVFVLMDNTGRTSNNLLSSASLTPKNTPYLDSNLWLHSPFSRMPILFSTFWWILSCWSKLYEKACASAPLLGSAGLQGLDGPAAIVALWINCNKACCVLPSGPVADPSLIVPAQQAELNYAISQVERSVVELDFQYFIGFLHRLPPNLRVAASWSPELTQRRQAQLRMTEEEDVFFERLLHCL